jgi:hypothetical protein
LSHERAQNGQLRASAYLTIHSFVFGATIMTNMDFIRRSGLAVLLGLGGSALLGACDSSEPDPSRSRAAREGLVAGSGALDDAGIDADGGLDTDGGDGDAGDTDAGDTDAGETDAALL